jgi:hypothetical protein
MRKLIDDTDLRKLLAGAAGVAVVGVLAGAAMQPKLLSPGELAGQQIQAGVSGVRTPYDGTIAYSSYASGVPDYVIGTDWLKPPQYAYEALPEPVYDDGLSAFDEPAYEPVAVAAWQEPPREPTRYPSTDGGAAYSIDQHAVTAEAAATPETALEPTVDPETAELAAATPG